MTIPIKKDSLVLYKSRPAQVTQLGDKLEIKLDDGKSVKVRSKDVTPLHPGPYQGKGSLKSPTGDRDTAWELLAGETTTLAELAELIYDEFTPATAWATWQEIDEGLYFKGTPDAVEVCTAEVVEQVQQERATKAAEKAAWHNFLLRVDEGTLQEGDDRYLGDVVQLALGQQSKSRVLRELGKSETPEEAHTTLLRLKYWDHTNNPYPHRLELATTSPELELPALPNEDRLDLTHLPAFAIDDADSTDPDDAISLEGNRLWVHVADVAALIPPDSPADEEARARGANLYLPEKTVHMLPEQATDILALGLAEISPALSFGLDVNNDGTVENVVVQPSWVRVERLSYKAAEARLGEEPLRSIAALTERFTARRQANHAIELDLPEVKVRVKDDAVVINPLLKLKSREMVREAMLMAGEAVANFAIQNEIPFPYTTQERSEDVPEPLILPETLSGMFALRLSMRPGQVKSTPGKHAGLGLDTYVRVTSPLRRYLDLVAHQQLRAYLRGAPLLDEQTMLVRAGAAEAISGAVRSAERSANQHWKLVYFMQNPDWEGEGIIVDQRGRNYVVIIPELDFELRLPVKGDPALDSIVPLALRSVKLPTLEANFRIRS